MLNRNSRKFLRFLRNSKPDFDDRVYTYAFIEEHYAESISMESVFATVRYLDKIGYLEIATANGISLGVVLTELSLHPYEFQIERIKNFLFKSILVPIIVSFVTTLITNLLAPNLLQALLEYLQELL